eukprot:6672706-Prymnesium_polylepis.1
MPSEGAPRRRDCERIVFTLGLHWVSRVPARRTFVCVACGGWCWGCGAAGLLRPGFTVAVRVARVTRVCVVCLVRVKVKRSCRFVVNHTIRAHAVCLVCCDRKKCCTITEQRKKRASCYTLCDIII